VRDHSVLPDNIDHLAKVLSFADVKEVYTSRDFGQAGYDDNWDFLGDTIVTVDGDRHRQRLVVEKQLFKKSNLERYEEEVLIPSIREQLDRLPADEDGVVHADLVPLARLILTHIAARIIGIDDISDEERLDRLAGMTGPLANATRLKFATGDREQLRQEYLVIKQEYVDDFIEPARLRREQLVARHKAGELSAEELPADLLTTLLLHGDPEWDAELFHREAILYLVGSTLTTAQATPHALFHILTWVEEHPDERDRLKDPEFLRHGAYESMRLHASSPAHFRRARCDVTLKSGNSFEEGTEIAVVDGAAGFDPEVFGEDVEEFNPHREPKQPGVRRYSASFAFGEHKCIGEHLAAGIPPSKKDAVGTKGMVLQLITALVARDVALVPGRPPLNDEETTADFYSSFPVTFRASENSR
jgi:cytochrome P450